MHAFAQLTPKERLVETMSTIGGFKMVEQFEQLANHRIKEIEHEEVFRLLFYRWNLTHSVWCVVVETSRLGQTGQERGATYCGHLP